MVLSFIDDQYKAAAKWAIISLVAFIIPDLYIFLGTRELPRRIIIIVLVIISITLTAGIVSVVRKVRAGRAAKAAAMAGIQDEATVPEKGIDPDASA